MWVILHVLLWRDPLLGPATSRGGERGHSPRSPVTYRWQCEEGDCKDGEAGGDGLANPRLGHLVPVANGGDGDL